MEDARPSRLTLKRRDRVRRRADFVRAYEVGRRFSMPLMMVWVAANGARETRIGISVSRRHGNSVRHNRLRRVVREAFRRVRADLPRGLDVIVSPRFGAELSLTPCAEQLLDAIRRGMEPGAPATRGRGD